MQKIQISERSLKRGKVCWEQSQEDLAQAKDNVKTKPEISCLMSVQASINAISSILEANGHFQLPAFSCVEMLDLALQYHEVKIKFTWGDAGIGLTPEVWCDYVG